ncbi:MAG: formyltransferase family protein [Candidatus Omnitrophota bacterium]
MNILISGIVPSPLAALVQKPKTHILETEQPFDVDFLKKNSIDFVISYRYRHRIRKPVIDYMKGNIINLHISYLPFNRGADPNLWSFLEDSAKGCSIHFIDEGIDTGDLIVRRRIEFEAEGETLASTYLKLNQEVIRLFDREWPKILAGKSGRMKQPAGGTSHKLADRKCFEHLLSAKGWETPVNELKGKALGAGKRKR